MRLKLGYCFFLGFILMNSFSSFCQKQEPQFMGGQSMLSTYLSMKLNLPDTLSEDYHLNFDLHITKDGKAKNPQTNDTVFRDQLELVVAEMPLWDISGVEVKEEGYSVSVSTLLNPPIYTKVDEQATFPGGTADMYRFIGMNLKLPVEAREKGFKQKVYVRFTINSRGKIIKPTILRSGGEACDAEALRILSLMPVWTAAKLKGKNVSSYFVMPLIFRSE